MDVGTMLIREKRFYNGSIYGNNVIPKDMAHRMKSTGKIIGKILAKEGYRGWFGIDFRLSTRGEPIIEENSAALNVNGPVEFNRIQELLNNIEKVYRQSGEMIIPTKVSSLQKSTPKMGFAVVAPEIKLAFRVYNEVKHKLASNFG